ncbi:MAG: 6-phosphofructokinase [Propionibacteriaceae bacterium]|jgi:6-phosphofructokinase 1|nr:6-phosphofructokinase [Propionibacteriaceae bacterium]
MWPLLIDPDRARLMGAGKAVAVLTGGGDAQGMNAALRAVVRTAISCSAQAYAVSEGYQGLIDGAIEEMPWDGVSGILDRGGTVIGTFRSKDFLTRAGRLEAALNLVSRGIDRLVVIGGDGSLTGLDVFAGEWPGLLEELERGGRLSAQQRRDHPRLVFAGLVGSIDNDLVGTDMTIGADSALHRIQDALDCVSSTAASHQRAFVVEVMGRHCGYLAVMAALCGGGDWLLIPEHPPPDGWQAEMCQRLRRGRQAGRKDSIVILAEGATDRQGQPITSAQVRQAIEDGLGEEARVTILGHVQRGGTPSAYDRWASTWLGYSAASHVLTCDDDRPGPVFGFRGHQVVAVPLVQAVADTRRVPELVAAGDYAGAVASRGSDFATAWRIFNHISDPDAAELAPDPVSLEAGDPARRRRIGVMHAGGLAPGMNTAAKTVVRLGLAAGFEMVGVEDGFAGLAAGAVGPLTWKDVDGWSQEGGAALGTRRWSPGLADLYAIARAVEESQLDALVVIGGWTAYQGVALMENERERYPSLRIPMVCVPATIDNNLPATQIAVGADTALNVIVDVIDKIRSSASASQRCFVAETMGRDCGYLALMGGLAGGAEQIYLNETGVSLDQIRDDLAWLTHSFDHQKRSFFLAVRNEQANANFTTEVLSHLIDEAAQGRYDTRTMRVGHIQQGGSPTPADRILATQLSERALHQVAEQLSAGTTACHCVGLDADGVQVTELALAMRQIDPDHQRPSRQWWLGLGDLVGMVNRRA